MRKADALARIDSQINELAELKLLSRENSIYKKWRRDTEITLSYVFGEGSRHVREFRAIRFAPLRPSGASSSEIKAAYLRGLESASVLLHSMQDEIRNYWPEDASVLEATSAITHANSSLSKGRDIFLVHGHDEGLKQEVARFLEKLELNPIILHEQPNKGRTIIEKFEQHASVGFAIAMFTADDLCSSNASAAPIYRARQNVVFEFGFFIGKLGRERVCALYDEGVELPSDYQGVIYVPLDKSGRWKFDLLKELKSAGYEVDANLALF